MANDLQIIIYTDSKYVHHVLHAHAPIWQERGFLTAQNSPIKHWIEVLQILEAVKYPAIVAVTHCRGHQSNLNEISLDNNFADKIEKTAALCIDEIKVLSLLPVNCTSQPNYTPKGAQGAKEKGYILLILRAGYRHARKIAHTPGLSMEIPL